MEKFRVSTELCGMGPETSENFEENSHDGRKGDNLRVKVAYRHLLATQSMKIRKLMLVSTPQMPITQMS